MSARDQKKKDRKGRETEKFDNNVDVDLVSNQSDSAGPSGNSSVKDKQSAGSSHSNGDKPNEPGSDRGMASFCDILKQGFQDVSKNISDKLTKVGHKMTKSVQEAQKDFSQKIDALSVSRRDDHEVSDSDTGMGYGFDASSYSDSDCDRADSVSNKSDAPAESFFKKLNKPPPTERVGDKVNDDLAEATDRFFRKPISPEEFKELKTKYVRPENVQWLRAPEIPPNVYKRLSSDFKSTDKVLFHIQEQLCPVAISLTYALEKLEMVTWMAG